MTNTQSINKTASQMSVKDLKSQSVKIFTHRASFADDVANSILNALKKKLGEQEFAYFKICNSRLNE